MNKIKLFLGAYINSQNAQNINCLAIAKFIDKSKFEIYTLERNDGNIDIDFLRDSCHISMYNNKLKFTKIWKYIYGLYKCDVIYLPKQEKLKALTLLNKLIFKKTIFITLEGIIDDYAINYINSQKKTNLQKYLTNIHSVEYVYSITNFMRKYNHNKIGLKSKNKILYLGVDNKIFTQKGITKKRLENIIFIGNDMKRKGIEEYLKLASIFKDINFYIVGKGSGIDFEKIKHKYNNVIICGSLSPQELNQILQQIDLHILPSKSEGFPKVILETAIVGVPSLIYSHYGAKEWMENDYNGFVIDNFKSLENKILELSNNNEKLYNNSINATKLAKRFQWNNIIKEWENEIIQINKI